jgi:Holliday junction resolvase RusA-like endonuclease
MIKLSLPMPPSTNGLFANKKAGGRFKTKPYKDWQKLAGACVKDSHRLNLGPYSISIALKRSTVSSLSDLTNREKAVSDLLVSHGIVKDDRYCQRLVMCWDEALDGECVVLIQEYTEGLAV